MVFPSLPLLNFTIYINPTTERPSARRRLHKQRSRRDHSPQHVNCTVSKESIPFSILWTRPHGTEATRPSSARVAAAHHPRPAADLRQFPNSNASCDPPVLPTLRRSVLPRFFCVKRKSEPARPFAVCAVVRPSRITNQRYRKTPKGNATAVRPQTLIKERAPQGPQRTVQIWAQPLTDGRPAFQPSSCAPALLYARAAARRAEAVGSRPRSPPNPTTDAVAGTARASPPLPPPSPPPTQRP